MEPCVALELGRYKKLNPGESFLQLRYTVRFG